MKNISLKKAIGALTLGSALSSLLVFSSLEAIDLSSVKAMSGKQGDACGALLCLSGGMSSGACAPYIAKYFAIQLSKPWKTAQARKNFLNLCPVASEDGNTDPELAKLQNDILPYVSGGCTKEELNRIEKSKRPLYYEEDPNSSSFTKKRPIYGYRINPLPTENCSLLMKSPYFPQKISYTCSQNFYDEKTWNDGFTKQYISQSEFDSLSDDLKGTETKSVEISKLEYDKLPNEQRDKRNIIGRGDKDFVKYYKLEPLYYKKNFIKKDCWLVEDKEVVVN